MHMWRCKRCSNFDAGSFEKESRRSVFPPPAAIPRLFFTGKRAAGRAKRGFRSEKNVRRLRLRGRRQDRGVSGIFAQKVAADDFALHF